jgi:glucose/arabinose dehydrogenase
MKPTTLIPPALLALASFAMLAGCGGSDSTPSAAGEPQLTRTTYMQSLTNPWDLAFAPDGTMFYTEKCHGLSVRRTDGTTQRLFGMAGSSVVAANDFYCQGQSGMHGVAVDANFASNRYVFVFMLSNLSTPDTNRVVRLVVDNNYTTVSGRTDIVTNIAFKAQDNSAGSAGAHSGGRIRIGPTDGLLYITTGDNHNGPLPQDLTQLGGKVLRIDRNGAAAAGNNTPMGGDARIFTYGHRNVQGIAFRPGSNQPFSCEHGPGHTDEVTPLVAGGNGGWDPTAQAGVTCGDNYCGYGSNRTDGAPTRMTDRERYPNAMLPSWTNNGESDGMGPCAFLTGTQWRDWEGRLAVGIMAAQNIRILQLDASGMTTANQIASTLPAARTRSLTIGPDGALYTTTDAGQIWRIAAQ